MCDGMLCVAACCVWWHVWRHVVCGGTLCVVPRVCGSREVWRHVVCGSRLNELRIESGISERGEKI